MSKIPENEMAQMIKRMDDAFGEFHQFGEVKTVKCNNCDGLIVIKPLSYSAWEMNCPCSKYKDVLKGI
jgi:hypothetical protein